MTIDLDNSSKNAVSNLSESADKIEPNPLNFDKNGKEKFEMSHSFQRTDGNTDSKKVVTGPGNHFKKPILTDEPKTPIIQVALTFSIPENAWMINIWNAALDSCAKTLLLPATRVNLSKLGPAPP